MKISHLSLVVFISLIQCFGAGIPVVDTTANQQSAIQNSKQIAEWAKEASRWTETVEHYQKQLQAYAEELKAKTGIKDSVSTLKDFSQIYADFGRAYENIQDFNEKALSDPESFIKDKLDKTYSKYMIFDRCESIQDKNRKNICLTKSLTTAAEIQSTQEKAKQLSGIAKAIQEIEVKMKKSKDIKESQDLANALSVQTAKVGVINANLQNEHYRYEAEKRAKEEQAKQLLKKGMQDYSTPRIFK